MSEPLDVLLRHWRALLACVLLSVLASAALTLTATKQYTASSALFFSIRLGNTATELNQGAMYVQAQMPSYQELATSSLVLQRADQALGGVGLVADQVEATVPTHSALLVVSATRTTPGSAAAVANAVADQLQQLVAQTAPTGPQSRALLTVQPVRTALPPRGPSSPDALRNGLAGAGAGLLLGAAAAYVLESRRSRRVAPRSALPEWDLAPEPVDAGADRR